MSIGKAVSLLASLKKTATVSLQDALKLPNDIIPAIHMKKSGKIIVFWATGKEEIQIDEKNLSNITNTFLSLLKEAQHLQSILTGQKEGIYHSNMIPGVSILGNTVRIYAHTFSHAGNKEETKVIKAKVENIDPNSEIANTIRAYHDRIRNFIELAKETDTEEEEDKRLEDLQEPTAEDSSKILEETSEPSDEQLKPEKELFAAIDAISVFGFEKFAKNKKA